MDGNTDRLGRRNRIAPQSTGKRLTPQERDLLWFSKLAEHGPLPSSFLLAYAHDTHRSEKRAREKAAAVRRARKMDRKRMERDGIKQA